VDKSVILRLLRSVVYVLLRHTGFNATQTIVKTMIEKVISGGQTGADIAGLKAAKACGIATGGYMPKGYRTLDGPKPEYAELYNLVELDSSTYPPRTQRNVAMSDITIRFATNWVSPGELCTKRYINEYNKPWSDVDPRDMTISPLIAAEKLCDENFKVINIAGNSELTSPGIEQWVFDFLCKMFEHMVSYDKAFKAVEVKP